MIESFVDLTYRGLSLGRRIKLSEVRPSSGYLELPTPMPVGTRVAIVTDDGGAIDATVSWVYEQVGGSDRAPGVVVTPDLSSAAAAAWWTARVELTDDPPRRRTRSRPVTARPRTPSASTPPSSRAGGTTASIAADLDARVAAAAGVSRPTPAPSTTGERLEPVTIPDGTPVMPTTGEHAIVDDAAVTREAMPRMRTTGEHSIDEAAPTIIMQSVDPAALGLDPGDAEVTDPGSRGPVGHGEDDS